MISFYVYCTLGTSLLLHTRQERNESSASISKFACLEPFRKAEASISTASGQFSSRVLAKSALFCEFENGQEKGTKSQP